MVLSVRRAMLLVAYEGRSARALRASGRERVIVEERRGRECVVLTVSLAVVSASTSSMSRGSLDSVVGMSQISWRGCPKISACEASKHQLQSGTVWKRIGTSYSTDGAFREVYATDARTGP